MKLKLIYAAANPDRKEAELILEYVNKITAPSTEIYFESIGKGFPQIMTETQGMINGVEIISIAKKAEADGMDGILIYCFDDPAVAECREIVSIPVVGLFESTILFAKNLSEKIGLIATDQSGIKAAERRLGAWGLTGIIGKIKSIGLTEIDFKSKACFEKIISLCRELENEGLYIAVIGCGSSLICTEYVRRRLTEENIGVQIIDPAAAAVITLESCVRLGMKNAPNAVKVDFNKII